MASTMPRASLTSVMPQTRGAEPGASGVSIIWPGAWTTRRISWPCASRWSPPGVSRLRLSIDSGSSRCTFRNPEASSSSWPPTVLALPSTRIASTSERRSCCRRGSSRHAVASSLPCRSSRRRRECSRQMSAYRLTREVRLTPDTTMLHHRFFSSRSNSDFTSSSARLRSARFNADWTSMNTVGDATVPLIRAGSTIRSPSRASR